MPSKDKFKKFKRKKIDEAELADALERYTNPDDPEYDPEFDAKIRKLRPDWFGEDVTDRN